MYRLRTSPASPFGRKVALAAAATGLADRLVIEPADVNDPNDSLLEQNPLGKIPTLITPEG
ncbi:glutathione S-transferase N-terminal domain-containing protein [Sodalis sp. (in: enterobacteria)]